MSHTEGVTWEVTEGARRTDAAAAHGACSDGSWA
jgi:hypothetical protein